MFRVLWVGDQDLVKLVMCTMVFRVHMMFFLYLQRGTLFYILFVSKKKYTSTVYTNLKIFVDVDGTITFSKHG